MSINESDMSACCLRFLRQVPIDRRLDFVANAERTVARRFDRNFDRAFDRAVRTAR